MSDLKEKKRVRSANYTAEECLKLLELVRLFKDVVENKKTDAVSWMDKVSFVF